MYLKLFANLSLSLCQKRREKLILFRNMPMIKNCSGFIRLLNPKAESLAIFHASKSTLKTILTLKLLKNLPF